MTECLGGSMELSEEELGLRYQVRLSLASFSKPSLNLSLTTLLGCFRVSVTPD